MRPLVRAREIVLEKLSTKKKKKDERQNCEDEKRSGIETWHLIKICLPSSQPEEAGVGLTGLCEGLQPAQHTFKPVSHVFVYEYEYESVCLRYVSSNFYHGRRLVSSSYRLSVHSSIHPSIHLLV